MKKYYYLEPQVSKRGAASCAVKEYNKAMPVYPKALRFGIADHYQAFLYLLGASDFIRSTKIPASCKLCPIYNTAFMCNGHCGQIMCHVTWHKIWEYVI